MFVTEAQGKGQLTGTIGRRSFSDRLKRCFNSEAGQAPSFWCPSPSLFFNLRNASSRWRRNRKGHKAARFCELGNFNTATLNKRLSRAPLRYGRHYRRRYTCARAALIVGINLHSRLRASCAELQIWAHLRGVLFVLCFVPCLICLVSDFFFFVSLRRSLDIPV